MNREGRARIYRAQRAALELEEIVIAVLEEYPEGLGVPELARTLDLENKDPFIGDSHQHLARGVLDRLKSRNLIEKVDGRAVLI